MKETLKAMWPEIVLTIVLLSAIFFATAFPEKIPVLAKFFGGFL